MKKKKDKTFGPPSCVSEYFTCKTSTAAGVSLGYIDPGVTHVL